MFRVFLVSALLFVLQNYVTATFYRVISLTTFFERNGAWILFEPSNVYYDTSV